MRLSKVVEFDFYLSFFNMDKTKNIIIAIVIIIVIFLTGFFIGRKTIKVEPEVKIQYVELDPIHDTIINLVPNETIEPQDTAKIIQDCIKKGIYTDLFPTKIITDSIKFTSEDTLKIVQDWATSRLYTQTLFDNDTLGTCNVNLTVQYNRLDGIGYKYTPKQKQVDITKTIIKTFEPFIGLGLTVGRSVEKTENQEIKIKEENIGPSAELGFYIKQHHGVAVQYQYISYPNISDLSNHEVTLKYLYKF